MIWSGVTLLAEHISLSRVKVAEVMAGTVFASAVVAPLIALTVVVPAIIPRA
jgi:hypothetical protein